MGGPMSIIFKRRSIAVILGATFITSFARISPASNEAFILIIERPVFLSPFIIAQLIGAAPRYRGKRDACTLSAQRRGILKMLDGKICPYAITINNSTLYVFKSSIKEDSFKSVGCKTVIL